MFPYIFLTIVAIGVVVFIYQLHETDKIYKQQGDPDREPQRSDLRFSANGIDDVNAKFRKEHKAWEERQEEKKRNHILYELPLAEALAREDAEGIYMKWLNVRNKKRMVRGKSKRVWESGYDYNCQICGEWIHESKDLAVCLCARCREKFENDLPTDASESEKRIYIRKMAVALDVMDGVISRQTAKREIDLIVGFENSRESLEAAAKAREDAKQQAKQNEKDKFHAQLDNVAKSLFH